MNRRMSQGSSNLSDRHIDMGILSDDINRLREMTPDDIHDLLAAEGITGTPGHPRRCPLAIWLIRRHPNRTLSVLAVEVETWEEGRMCAYTTPGAVREFIVGFDLHQYPELIEEEGRIND